MNEALGNWESSRWNERLMIFVERAQQNAASNLSRRPTIQSGWIVATQIPAQELGLLAFDFGQVGELVARPKRFHPQAVEVLDLVVAFGIVEGSEDGLDATEQTQAHHLANDAQVPARRVRHRRHSRCRIDATTAGQERHMFSGYIRTLSAPFYSGLATRRPHG